MTPEEQKQLIENIETTEKVLKGKYNLKRPALIKKFRQEPRYKKNAPTYKYFQRNIYEARNGNAPETAEFHLQNYYRFLQSENDLICLDDLPPNPFPLTMNRTPFSRQ